MTGEDITKALTTIPKVDVVTRGGKPTTIDDYDGFMQFLLLSSLVSQTVKIRRYFEDMESVGWIQNFKETVTSDFPPICFRLAQPAQSISIRNDGPGTILVEWNKRLSSKTELDAMDKCDINFGTHKLYRFYVQATPEGAVATFRAVAKG